MGGERALTLVSLGFVAFALVVALLSNATPSPMWRSGVLLIANCLFVGSYVTSALQLLPFAAFLLLGFVVIEAVRRHPSSLAQWLGFGAITLSFIFLKKYSFLGASLALPFPYLIIGLSYVLFRVLHLLIDARQGELREPIGLLDFFNYTCNFLTFTAGPIQRFEDYRAQRQLPTALEPPLVRESFSRIAIGYVKVAVVSAIFNNLFASVSSRVLAPELARSLSNPAFVFAFAAAAVCYTVYLYYNFSGYVDIVIGVGWLCGQRLPENFNRPFSARNFLDFWSRWHMTLSDWFKTYLFNPLFKVLAARFQRPSVAPYLGVVAFFVTFLVMGVWHGTTSVFVVYGVVLGAGASLNKLWQVFIQKRLGKKAYKALSERPAAIYLSRGLTSAYFALALTCLWVNLAELQALVHRLGIVGLVACYAGLTAVTACAFVAWDRLSALLARRTTEGGAQRSTLARDFALAAQVLLIFAVSSFFHKAPEFVYRAF